MAAEKRKRINLKKIIIWAASIIAVLLAIAGIFFVWVNRQAFLEQINYNEERSFEYYEEIKDEWVNEPNRIEIPKLGLIAKVTYPDDNDEMDRLLTESIAHMPQSVLPGEEGNAVYTGHSSAPVDNDYSHVFATLNKLRFGDEIYVYVENERYTYQVRKKSFVKATEMSVVSQDNQGLTLITCWPIGTNLNRLIIFAEML